MATYTVGSGKDYSTIAAAIGAARADDVVIIDPGTYEEHSIDLYYNGLTIKSADETTPFFGVIMDGLESTSRDYAFNSYASGVLYQHITFKNFEEGAVSMGSLSGRSLEMSGCLAYGCDGPVLASLGFNASTGTEIRNCMFIVDSGRAVTMLGDSKVLMENSVFATNAPTEAIIMSSNTYLNVTASHCTFVGDGNGLGAGRNYHLVTAVAQVDNCILFGGEGAGIQALDHHHNLVYFTGSNSGSAFPVFGTAGFNGAADDPGTGDITGNPNFTVAPVLGRLAPGRLNVLNVAAGSIAINAGSSAYSLDLSGSARAGNPDIGAFELIAVGAGYPNNVLGVDSDDIGKLLGIETADVTKVLGVE
jgi:hypothetical protein